MRKTMAVLAFTLALLFAFSALADNVLRPGDTGDEVKAAQERLAYYGYYNTAADGKYGPATTSAVKAFQRRNDLDVDGKIGPVTLAVLNSNTGIHAPITQDDDNNPQRVIHIQTRLALYGYYKGDFDGVYGTKTIAAVKAFQRRNQLEVDGKVGANTLAVLNTNTAVFAPVSADSDASQTVDRVKRIQERLLFYGYYLDVADGVYGAVTEAAVRSFQKANGLKVDGKVGAETLAKLESSTAISKAAYATLQSSYMKLGDRKNDVLTLQYHLVATYFYAGTPDDVFDAAVESAVKQFQSAAGIQADGIVGPVTRDALFNRTAAIFSGGATRRTMSSGMRGWDVKVLQERLTTLKYYNAAVTGVYDVSTVTAVRAFQLANGLEQSGKVNAVTRRYLWPTQVDSGETGTPTLRKGDSGTYVSKAQMRLKAAGFLSASVDGIYGDITYKAVRAFQKSRGLVVDGKVGPNTWAKLLLVDISNMEPSQTDPTVVDIRVILRPGDRGAAVRTLQTSLRQLGYSLTVDGVFGTKTTEAVKDFQRRNDLKIDGKVGPATQAVINALLP